MKTLCRWRCQISAGFVLAALTTAGCQTWVPAIGMTLPSPRYLQHPPQYIPPSPPFPLPRELSAQEAVAAAPIVGAAPAVPLPPPVPPAAAAPAPAPGAPPPVPAPPPP